MNDKNFLRNSIYWQVISENTGYDFSGYSAQSMNRRLENFISSESIGCPEDLNDMFDNPSTGKKILGRLLTNYTEMFRDPDFFISLKENVLAYLSTYPRISIWHAGCSTGEEVYSLAILLDELNLLDRCDILATDINEMNLKNASSGIFALSRMKEAASRYFSAGGKRNLSHYYTAYYDHVIFNNRLREKINFKTHDMILEIPENRFHLILCRNVFIYFDRCLKTNVLKTFSDSLHNYGYLGWGQNENLFELEDGFLKGNLTAIDSLNKIYRKVV